MNMLEGAQMWVDHHRAHCTSETCGCADADRDEMVESLVEMWLFSD